MHASNPASRMCFCGVVVVTIVAATFMKPDAKAEKREPETFRGKIVPLAEVLKKSGIELDPEAAPHWLALQTDDGKLYPLIKDEGSRPFYRDPHLLKRPMEVRGRLPAGSQLLQVLQLHSVKDGKPHDVYYWCDVCAIKRHSLEKQCECCGGPMELRETLLK